MLEALTGAVLGARIVTLKEQDELLHELVAVHVTDVVPTANVLPDNGKQTTVAAGMPVEVGSVHVATGLHCEISPGQALMTGDSLMVTMNEQLLGDPQPFVAVQVTVEVPNENVDPDKGEHTTVAAGSPVAVGSVHVAMLLSH